MTRHHINSQWTPEKIVDLKTLWIDGLHSEQIAERLGITGCRNGASAVYNKAKDIGLPSRSNEQEWTAERIALLNEIFRKGSLAWVADEINKRTGSHFTRSAIAGKSCRLGLVVKHPRGRDAYFFERIARKSTKPKTATVKSAQPTIEPPTELAASLKQYDEVPLPAYSLGIPFSKLTARSCRYSKGYGPQQLFCGRPTLMREIRAERGRIKLRASSFCPDCHARCWRTSNSQKGAA